MTITAAAEGGLESYEPVGPKRLVAERRPRFAVRPGTSDVKAVEEVWSKNAYRKARLGFTIGPGQRWIDGGANVGAFASLVHHLGGVCVAAVEAEATNAAIARTNIEANGGDPSVVLHAAIVRPSHPGPTVPLFVNTAPLALRRHSIAKARRDATTVDVTALRIDGLVEGTGADSVKLNIEGEEIPLLAEWTPPTRVRRLVAEWSFDVDNRLATLASVVARLGERFDRVHLSKRMPPGDVWPFYPPNVYLFAWDETTG